MLLDGIDSPAALRQLTHDELKQLAAEIREVLVETVSENGGHLASNLGVVELTIALHRVFDSPNDKLVWDVGHQSYVHKLLTGRRASLSDAAAVRRFVRLHLSRGKPARCLRRRARQHFDFGRSRHGPRARPDGGRSPRHRGHRRRRADRRHGAGGAEPRQPSEHEADRRSERQRHGHLADGGRRVEVPDADHAGAALRPREGGREEDADATALRRRGGQADQAGEVADEERYLAERVLGEARLRLHRARRRA